MIFNGTQLSIPENATPVKVYLYVPYNWDNKGTNPADGAATTYLTIHFNNATFQPGNYTRWYWDQSNFGGYPHYKYGLLVYDVTEYYLKNQDNAVFVNLTVPASQQTHTLSMFPFTLLVIYNDTSRPPTGIYINEEYDILLLDPNFSVQPEECIAYVNFPGIPDVEKVSNATYMTWVTHAGPNEGNVYFNNETLGLNVWQGNSKTSYPEIFNVTGKLNSTENRARIQGTSSGGMGAILQILMVEYVESLAANFTASPTMGVAPLTVQFTDLSTEATEWYWDFNNDTIIDSREQNPTYTYTQPGTYTVTLTVKGPGGENTLTKENCITVAKVMNLDTNRTFDRIQDAINDNSTVAGHTILVGEGNYTENIVLNKPLTLKANGLVNIIASTSTGTVIDVKANDTRIEGFTIQGANGTNGKGINIDTQYRCTLINNTVINNYYGIYIKDSEGCQLHNNRLQDNLLNFGVFDTVSTDGSKFNQEIDTSNTINGNPVYYLKNVQNRTINETVGFLAIINGTNVTIKDITVSNNSQGILIVTSSDCTIQNTTILNNRHGIYLWNSTGITIKTSTITNTQANAIIAYKQNNNLIIENNTIMNSSNAIYLYNGVTSTIQYNNVQGSTYGIYVSGDGNNTIAYNNITSGGLLVYGANNIVTDNIVNPGTVRSVIYISGNNNFIANNTVYVADKSGIRVEGGGNNTIIANTAIGTNKQGYGIVPLNGDTVQDNIVTNCNYGIWPFNAQRCTITGNNVTGCNYGLYVTGGSNHTIIGNIIKENSKGIRLTGTGTGASTGNMIYDNYFINNTNQTEGNPSNNNWNTTGGGNYWSDYTGDDLDGDGIGDTPYQGDQKPLIADLLIENITATSNSIQVRVKNNGKADITKIDPDATFPVNITCDSQEFIHEIPALQPGESRTITQNLNLTLGDYIIIANITYTDMHYLRNTNIRDANINNNVANTTVSLQRDLKVTNITYNPNNAAGHRELFANEPNTIQVTIYNEGNLDAGQFKVKLIVGEYNNTKILQGLAAGATANVTFNDFTPLTGPITINVIVDSDDEVEETNETNNIYNTTATIYYNGYKGKQYTNGSDINTVLALEGRLKLLYSPGNSTYRGSGSGNWQNPYIVIWTPADLPIPEGATIKEARLYQPYTWNTVGGIPDFIATFNNVTINPLAHYNDTKGYGSSNYPSGLLVYNVTSLFRPSENNTLTLTAGTNTTTALYGSYILIIYEHENETIKKIWINEETDMLYSRTDYGVNDTEATAHAIFNDINTNMLKEAKTIVITASANEANKSKFYFNNQEYTGFWQDYLTGPQIGFSTYQIKETLQNGTNTAKIQSYNNGSHGDNMVALQAILILEYEPPMANFTANATEGIAPLTVQFTDLSTEATEWYWDFNNDTIIDSTEQNPTYTYTQPGTYTVTLIIKGPGGENTLTKENYITVYQGPQFTLENLTVIPTSGVAPLNITVSANLTNSGDVAGNYTAQLKVNGQTVATKTIAVPAGQTVSVEFSRVLTAGVYNVTIDDLAPVAVTVLKPANITVGNLTVTPKSGVAPLNITVTANLRNTGDLAGNYTAQFKVNGQTVATKTIAVPAGGVGVVSFNYTLTSAGNYPVAINNLTAFVSVRSPGISVGQIIDAASWVRAYYERYGRLPSKVAINGQQQSMAQFLYLLCKATVNINAGNLALISVKSVASPTASSGWYRHGRIYRSSYVKVAKNILSFIDSRGRAPNYAITGLGRIPFQRLVYMYSKIIKFYGTNKRLPNYVTI
ncbi:cell surface glycoprotein (s-layer protein) [Methanothermobacter thermautotrophicus str. Delta H]|uniref:Cell surface glycoprotein (S-layer protein) n=2 Tax=Methanothermobacter thermautotrophicus TaxID=145262 RepID=O26812_METTH|nr:cell surface glycoprotein (s-layer protein) [Methanothermobacter thermautotrophicus str. Delta H]